MQNPNVRCVAQDGEHYRIVLDSGFNMTPQEALELAGELSKWALVALKSDNYQPTKEA